MVRCSQSHGLLQVHLYRYASIGTLVEQRFSSRSFHIAVTKQLNNIWEPTVIQYTISASLQRQQFMSWHPENRENTREMNLGQDTVPKSRLPAASALQLGPLLKVSKASTDSDIATSQEPTLQEQSIWGGRGISIQIIFGRTTPKSVSTRMFLLWPCFLPPMTLLCYF